LWTGDPKRAAAKDAMAQQKPRPMPGLFTLLVRK
jgi:hypothetical protein